MKHLPIVLVTDIPPSTNYSGGLFLNDILTAIDFSVADAFVLLNEVLRPAIPDETAKQMNFMTVKKPPEQYGTIRDSREEAEIRGAELRCCARIETEVLPSLLAFADQCKASAYWVLLEGQSMIRLAYALIRHTQWPVVIQVMDPPGHWLRTHCLDGQSTREVMNKFDFVMRNARSVAAASAAMAERYQMQYGTPAVPVIPSLPAEIARRASPFRASSKPLRIGFAGHIYAREEWNRLLAALDLLEWRIDGRAVEIAVYTRNAPTLAARHQACVTFQPWLDQRQLVAALAECDLTYCPYRFDETWRESAELCFPSKIVTYFATGRPVLFHGPMYSGPARFLAEWEAGFLCCSLDPETISAALTKIFREEQQYSRTAENGGKAFRACLTNDNLAHSARRFLAACRQYS